MDIFPCGRQMPAFLMRVGIIGGLCLLGGCLMMSMPGTSYKGLLPPLTNDEQALSKRLQGHVVMLAGTIGERTKVRYRQLQQSADYISARFQELGYTVREQPYSIDDKEVKNIEVELKGSRHPDEIVVVGAHYDSPPGSPGANDNASGVAALLELARHFKVIKPERTIRFVAFVNEEPPWFQTDQMGSRVYAAGARKRRENVVAMLSLETIGYYSDKPGSQQYPRPFSLLYPNTGNFIGFVGNIGSRALVRSCIGAFRETTQFPSEGLVAPEFIQGVGWSDHWSFWQEGYPGIMVTDTAPFRYPHYHEESDTPDKIDFERMARVVAGLGRVLERLVK